MNRAARMERHHKRRKNTVGLNLVSMMDIFTILVFFLLVNSGDVEELSTPNGLELPESIAEEKGRETVVVLVTDEEVLVQGRVVGRVADIMASDAVVIPELKAALERETERTLRADVREDVAGREVTIMGDKEIPYRLLKKVMATCTEADYGRLSLAVLQTTSEAQLAAAAN
ncbi:MAG TPA: biopolymer transporter ExbD [Gammaproteobacteria bacterium]